MENLWKKHSDHSLYVDCFESVHETFIAEIDTWLCSFNSNRSSKSHKRKVVQPLSDEINPKRSKQSDIIIENSTSQESIPKESQRFVPRLSYPANVDYPDLANVLDVETNSLFGRHIVANDDIAVGQIIAIPTPIAQVVAKSPDLNNNNNLLPKYCLTCFNLNANNFVSCAKCSNNVMFCSEECRATNQTHNIECASIFYQTNADIRLAIQMVLTRIKTFSSAAKMMKCFEKILHSNDTISSHGILLNLTRLSQENTILRAYRAYRCLMSMKFIANRFNKLSTQRFLMHFVLHCMAVIPANAFAYTINEMLPIKSIYGSLSFLNHSCAPNAVYEFRDGKAFVISTRPIKKYDQIFINYLGDKVKESVEERQYHIGREWNFTCKCERCMPTSLAPISHVIDDPHFRYIQRHRDDYLLPYSNKKRSRLRNECRKFLQKYGHEWSPILDDVTNSFLLCIIGNSTI